MIVKFKENKQGWLIKDKLYVVLSISFFYNESAALITIKSEDADIPILCPINEFEIIEPKINPNWIFSNYSDGRYSIQPLEFSGDFWEKFHDEDPESGMLFWKVYNELAIDLNKYI